jgi:hypothetical protein
MCDRNGREVNVLMMISLGWDSLENYLRMMGNLS